jgi:hypothetical protein
MLAAGLWSLLGIGLGLFVYLVYYLLKRDEVVHLYIDTNRPRVERTIAPDDCAAVPLTRRPTAPPLD